MLEPVYYMKYNMLFPFILLYTRSIETLNMDKSCIHYPQEWNCQVTLEYVKSIVNLSTSSNRLQDQTIELIHESN